MSFPRSLAGLDHGGLRLLLGVFFLALAIPTALLIWHAHGQLKWAAFHQQQQLAEEVAARVDARFQEFVTREEARSFGDYAFLVVAGDAARHFVQRSPLSAYPVEAAVPGLVGYFQVGADGAFSTPLLPVGAEAGSYGVSPEELAQRTQLQLRIWQILNENALVGREASKTATVRRVQDVARAKDPHAGGANALARDDRARRAAEAGAALIGAPAPSAVQEGSMADVDRSNEAAVAQAPFDELAKNEGKALNTANALGRVEDLKLDASRYAQASELQSRRQSAPEADAVAEKRAARKETVTLPEAPVASVVPALRGGPATDAPALAPPPSDKLRVRTFESDVGPFALSRLDSGHFVLFRNVWRGGQRYIQGVLIEERAFLDAVAMAAFRASTLADNSDLVVADGGNVLALSTGDGERRALDADSARSYGASADELNGALLYQTHLSAPLNDLELIFSVHALPPGPGASLLNWLAAVLALVLCAGFYLMYRLGAGQIALARQQQDFVSAVSHELKTPLTSIRMYGEMLRAGWGDEAQRRSYYEYIYGESERLSRLIHNVLQLARMNRNDQPLALKPISGGELMDTLASKVSSQVERAGFVLDLRCEPDAAEALVEVDPDAVLQIVINLVDNAVKFSAKAEQKRIELHCRRLHDAQLLLSVRDYGPGVARDQTRKIFQLFYRSGNELTRETVGTGIGLALVHQLARAMHGRADVLNREPGAEFRVAFPLTPARGDAGGAR